LQCVTANCCMLTWTCP